MTALYDFVLVYVAPALGILPFAFGMAEGGQEGEESDGGENSPNLEEKIENKLEDVMPEEALEAFRDQSQSTGDMETFAKMLYNENQSLREERRKLKQEKSRLETEGPEDKTVLDPETAKEISSRLPDGKDVSDLPEFLDKTYDAIQELNQRKKKEQIEKAASAAGVNAEALKNLEPDAEYSIAEVEDEGSGEMEKQAMIEIDGEETPLGEYLSDTYPAFETVLFESGDEEEEGDDSPVSVPGPGPSGDNNEDVDASEDGGDEMVDEWMESQSFAVPEPAGDGG
jgi:hypothetical protein